MYNRKREELKLCETKRIFVCSEQGRDDKRMSQDDEANIPTAQTITDRYTLSTWIGTILASCSWFIFK